MKNKKKVIIIIFFLTISCFRKDKPEEIFSYAIELWNEGKFNLAIKKFEDFLDTYSDHKLSPKANLWIGDIRYIYLNNPVQSVYDYKNLLKRYPESEYCAEAQWKIAKILTEDIQDKNIGIKEYQTFIKLFPNHELIPDAYYNIAEAYIYLEDYIQAITELELLIKRFKKANILQKALYKLGELYCLVKDFNKAINFLEKAYKFSNNQEKRLQIKELKADCYINKGEIIKGLRLYEEIIKNDPQNKSLQERINSLRNRIDLTIKEDDQNWLKR